VPAIESSFREVPPKQLFVDADFLIAALIQSETHHRHSADFLQQAAAHSTEIYLSSLTWLEFASAVTKDHFRARLPEEFQRRLELNRWQLRSVRRRYLELLFQRLRDTLDQFQWNEVSLSPEIRTLAIDDIMQFNLRSHDAVVHASASWAGVTDLASFDEAFRRVDGLVLWNDLIHAGKPIRG
jgi:predicted nucleic acid-binding protein